MSSPFGVELPENFGSDRSASLADTAPEGAAASAESPAGAKEPETREPQVTDLDSLERFRFQGRELSKDDLQKLLSGESDQPKSDKPDYDRAFRYDFSAVLEDPKLLAKFREIYPPEYVQIVERALSAQGKPVSQATSGQANPEKQADPRIDEMWQAVQEWKNVQKEQRVESLKTALDSSFEKLSKKYPDADPEVINSRLIAMRQMGTELKNKDGKLREDVIEDLFKRDNAARAKAREEWWSKKVEAQKSANSRARDVGQGGSASSPAPQKARSIKEATAAALASLEGR